MKWKARLRIYDRAQTLSAAKQQSGLQSLDLQIFTTISGEAGNGAQHEYSKQYHTHSTGSERSRSQHTVVCP